MENSALFCLQVYGDFEDLETGEKRSGEEAQAEEEEEAEAATRIVDYGGDAAREKGGITNFK